MRPEREGLMIPRALMFMLLAPAAIAASQTAPSAAPVATASVAYFEVAPSAVRRTIGLLQTYREAVRKAPGIGRVAVLQQVGRPNFFAIEETWQDGGSLQVHVASPVVTQLRADLEDALLGTFDQRLLAPVTVQAASGTPTDQSIYVVTHADSVDRSGSVPTMLQALASAARREHGNVLFDITVQPNRTNHFTLFEVWSDENAYEAHVVAENTRTFRAAFAPSSGALYDERIYKNIR
jgi:quinol monooxygenase YgiN